MYCTPSRIRWTAALLATVGSCVTTRRVAPAHDGTSPLATTAPAYPADTGAPRTPPAPPAARARCTPTAPPPGAGAPAYPPANLNVVLRFTPPPGEPANYLHAAGRHVLAFGWQHMIVYAIEHAAPAALIRFASAPGGPVNLVGPPPARVSLAPTRSTVPEYTDRSVDGVWLVLVAGELYALEQRTDQLRWRTDVYPAARADPHTVGTSVFLSHVVRSGEVLVVTTTLFLRGSARAEMLGLDWRTGAVLWRTPRPEGIVGLTAAGGRLYAALGDATVRAFEPASGRELWRQDLAPIGAHGEELPALVASAAVVAVLQPTGGVRAFDPRSGELLETLTPAGRIRTVEAGPVLDDCLLYASLGVSSTRPTLRGVDAAVLVAFDLSTGAVRWRTDESFAPPATPLALDTDALYTCGDEGTLVVYERATGAPRFALGLGMGCELAQLDPDAQGARPLVARLWDNAAALLARTATPWAAERARITGRVRAASGAPFANGVVRIGGDAARTDAAGRFDVVQNARGVVRVRAAEGNATGEATVQLDGRAGPYHVELALRLPGPVD
jgi:outer membrane protein assembly factor BamB